MATRYRGSLLGFLWSFLNPLLLMAIYALVFHFYIRFDDVDNYTIFLFTGLLPWIWFSSGLIEGTTSITSSGHLITKSMFPAQILPLVTVLGSTVHFLLTLTLLFIFMAWQHLPFYPTLFFLPVIILAQLTFMYGVALAMAALNVYYRDVQHLVGNILNLLFFLCPILYPVTNVPERFRFTLDLNPVAQIISSFHNVVLNGVFPTLSSLIYIVAFSGLSLMAGNMIFERYRESFAEML